MCYSGFPRSHGSNDDENVDAVAGATMLSRKPGRQQWVSSHLRRRHCVKSPASLVELVRNMNYVASLTPSCTGSTGSIGGFSTAYIEWHCNSLSYLLSLRSPVKVVLLHGLHSLPPKWCCVTAWTPLAVAEVVLFTREQTAPSDGVSRMHSSTGP